MPNDISVSLGEIQVSENPQDVLVAYGIGSCVAVGVYDPRLGIGGLLHAVLPEAGSAANGSSPGKYVNTGIPELINQLEKRGAVRSRLVVRLAGGANMLVAPGLSDTFNIGARNVSAAERTLSQLRVNVKSQETGGHAGRTVRMYVDNGRMTIRSMGTPEREF